MSLDYKYDIQVMAEEAAERDGKDYFSLSQVEQINYYEGAHAAWIEFQQRSAELRGEDR
jgi:hypothetical protein